MSITVYRSDKWMQQCIPGEEDMIRLGMFLGTFLKGEEIIYLRGELGAGKTTLVRGILRGLGFTGRCIRRLEGSGDRSGEYNP
jgi:hypothetical protein